VKEENGEPDYKTMLKNLAQDNQTVAETCDALIKSAQEIGDEGTADLGIRRIQVHQKAAWMLNSYLQ